MLHIAFMTVLMGLISVAVLNTRPSLALRAWSTAAFLFALTIFLGLRSSASGTDTETYISYFKNLRATLYAANINSLGFRSITSALRTFESPQIYISSLFLITVGALVAASFYAKLRSPLMPVAIYLSFLPGLDLSTNALRNGVAASIATMFLVRSITKRANIFGIALGSLIHSSSIIILVGRLVYRPLATRRRIFILYATMMITLGLSQALGDSNVLSIVSGLHSGNRLVHEFNKYAALNTGLIGGALKLYFLYVSVSLVTVSVALIAASDTLENDVFFKATLIPGLLGQWIYYVISSSEFSYRFMYITFPLLCISVSIAIEKNQSRYSKLARIGLLLFLAMNVVVTYASNTFSKYHIASLD